ncbi:MaoC/PaaZ C-terminal domain-containing protein [Hydrogenophaga sp. BPS33]|uniref:MaoC/PaaZ C-terminal domain-containing protein n=1 Tax=Hydrogenophaga sp. BPS33 TaxID=2651974 RepID=UPI00131F7FC3|nr:MaoC/PaaZ C-terminal domain-containing protein [Hydrogenophaga sp. BPS33]QHE84157.1 3-alpha,7-alpha,12-alpha-trihydroxy-5-beta-cholest-24-enoyl-CoA hydratase [Hydrogenophaga sp. BPS33]
MPLDPHRVLAHRFQPVEQTYGPRDAMLYALGIGYGRQTPSAAELDFLFEERLKVPPTFAVTLGFKSIRDENLGIDFARVVHSEQQLILHQPLPPTARVVCHLRVPRLVDRGADKGAMLYLEREVRDADSQALYATSTMVSYCRGDGGFRAEPEAAPAAMSVPNTPCEQAFDATLPDNAAFIYRLSGDYNPLHVNPAFASQAGFQKPILHGLLLLGEAGRLALGAYGGHAPERMRSIQCRFTRPTFAGDAIEVGFWRLPEDPLGEPDTLALAFRVRVPLRGETALDNGLVRFRAS